MQILRMCVILVFYRQRVLRFVWTYLNVPRRYAQDLISLFKETDKIVREMARTKHGRATRRKSQKDFAWITFPRAKHSRWDHMRMTYWVAKILVVILSCSATFRALPLSSIKAFLIASAWHDVGHYIFSHAAELIHGLMDHEERGKKIIIADPQIVSILKDHGVDPEQVCYFIDPEGRSSARKGDRILSPLLHGIADIDRISYILMDLRRCHFACETDMVGLFLSLLVGESEVSIGVAGIPYLLSLLHDRVRDRSDIDYHPVTRAAKRVFTAVINRAFELGILSLWDFESPDASESKVIRKLQGKSVPEEMRRVVKRIMTGRVHEPIFELIHGDKELRERLEGLTEEQVKKVESCIVSHLESLGIDVPWLGIIFDVPESIQIRDSINLRYPKGSGDYRDVGRMIDDLLATYSPIRIFAEPQLAAHINDIGLDIDIRKILIQCLTNSDESEE